MQENKYEISLGSLKDGKYKFSFEVEDSLFTYFDNTELKNSNITVDIELKKEGGVLILDFEIKGEITLPCDRCLEELILPIERQERLTVKFGTEDSDVTDVYNIQTLSYSATKLDLRQHIYDYINLSLPYQRYHPDNEDGSGGCNPEMLEYLNRINEKNENTNENNPAWDKLKELLN